MTSPKTPDYLENYILKNIEEASGRHCSKLTLGDHVPEAGDVVMQSNDYLSLANDKRIVTAKVDALMSQGHGDAISRVFAHHRDDAHRTFEKRVARLTQAEDAALVMSGYNANVGIIESFAVPDMPVYIDQRAHASLWSGAISAQASARPFRHNNVTDLEQKIRKYGPGLVVIDSLYSTNGRIAPLRDIVAVVEANDCVIIVDETHSFGTHGPEGAGLVVSEGLADKVHFRTFGLSKAMAARGGIIVNCTTTTNTYATAYLTVTSMYRLLIVRLLPLSPAATHKHVYSATNSPDTVYWGQSSYRRQLQ